MYIIIKELYTVLIYTFLTYSFFFLLPLQNVKVLRGAEGGEATGPTLRKTSSSQSSRKSFRLDYRLEVRFQFLPVNTYLKQCPLCCHLLCLQEEVTKSCRDKHGRWMNPWSTWRFPSTAAFLKFFFLDKDHSNVPTSKEVRLYCINTMTNIG